MNIDQCFDNIYENTDNKVYLQTQGKKNKRPNKKTIRLGRTISDLEKIKYNRKKNIKNTVD
jgi:hypothetical protein